MTDSKQVSPLNDSCFTGLVTQFQFAISRRLIWISQIKEDDDDKKWWPYMYTIFVCGCNINLKSDWVWLSQVGHKINMKYKIWQQKMALNDRWLLKGSVTQSKFYLLYESL